MGDDLKAAKDEAERAARRAGEREITALSWGKFDLPRTSRGCRRLARVMGTVTMEGGTREGEAMSQQGLTNLIKELGLSREGGKLENDKRF